MTPLVGFDIEIDAFRYIRPWHGFVLAVQLLIDGVAACVAPPAVF